MSILSLFGIKPSWAEPPVEIASPPSLFALELARVIRGELGQGETTANNEGPRLDGYRKGGPKGAWCAAGVAWGIETTAENLAVICPVRRSHSAKRLFKHALLTGTLVKRPMTGDLALWHRGALGAATGHIGVVSVGLRDGTWFCYEGNRGSFPSRWREYMHEMGEPNFLGFCRLP